MAAAYAGQRLRGVYETADTSPVATLRSWDTAMTVPGGEVAADAISSIGVRATHRRRGLLRALLVDDLAEAVRAGTPVAALTSTQGSLYERFGFGLAAWTRVAHARHPPRPGSGTRGPPAASGRSTRRASRSVAGPVQDRARRRHPGSMDRSAASWHTLITGGRSTTARPAPRSPGRTPPGAPPATSSTGSAESWWGTGSREARRRTTCRRRPRSPTASCGGTWARSTSSVRWGGRTPRSTNRSRGCSPTTAR